MPAESGVTVMFSLSTSSTHLEMQALWYKRAGRKLGDVRPWPRREVHGLKHSNNNYVSLNLRIQLATASSKETFIGQFPLPVLV